MDTDRLEAVGSPLIEDFLDCDQLGSDSEFDTSRSASPTRTLKRLHIHVDMACNEFLAPGPHHPERGQVDGLPTCSNVSQSNLYSSPDLDPFSAVCCYPPVLLQCSSLLRVLTTAATGVWSLVLQLPGRC